MNIKVDEDIIRLRKELYNRYKIYYSILKEVKMEEKKEDGIKILLKDVNKEYYRLTPQWQIRSTIEQISVC